jgi:hypothetical protein
MRRFFPSQNSIQPNEMGDNHRKRSYSRKKSLSLVVPSPPIDVLRHPTNTRIVRVRLVFIRIGKRTDIFLFVSKFPNKF